MYKLFFSALLLIFTAFPVGAFGAETSCPPESTRSCLCTRSDGNQYTSNASSITSGDLCAVYCDSLGSVSYAFTCGEENTPDSAGNISDYLDAMAASAEVPTITKENAAIPALSVPIPGLDLTGSVQTDSNGYIYTNMIGLYVDAVFSYALVLAAIFGVLMFTIAGFQYMTAGGDKGAVSKAKARMTNTIFGIIILMATYSIAFMIDPRTTRFNSLTLNNITAIESFPPEGEDDNVEPNTSLNGASEALSGDYLIPAKGGMMLDTDALTALRTAAADFYAQTGQQIYVSSATRDLQRQAELFYDNCLQTGGYCSVPTCNPASAQVIKKTGSKFEMVGELAGVTGRSSIISQLVTHASYGNCPHTSAVAVDLWCNDGGSNYQHDPACQDALIKTMINHGFCRLTSEVWHFEYEDKKVSRSCLIDNDSVSYTARSGAFSPSTTTCKRWDFKSHTCVTRK